MTLRTRLTLPGTGATYGYASTLPKEGVAVDTRTLVGAVRRAATRQLQARWPAGLFRDMGDRLRSRPRKRPGRSHQRPPAASRPLGAG